MRYCLLIWLTMPCLAQVDRAQFTDMLEQGREKQLLELIGEECVGFKIDRDVLRQIGSRDDVILSVLSCLYDRGVEKAPSATLPAPGKSVSPGDPPSPHETGLTSSPRRSPDQLPPPSLSSNALVTQKVLETLRTLAVAQTLQDKGQRVKTQIESKALLINMFKEHALLLSKELTASGVEVPAWAEEAIALARAAHEQSFPQLRFDVDRQTDFYGSVEQRGIRVYMSLSLMERLPDEVTPFHFEDQLLAAHPQFPMTYNSKEDQFELHRLKNTEVTRVRLRKALRDYEDLELFPGKWTIRLVAYDGTGRIQSDSSSHFQVEPGKDYDLQIGWEKRRGGIKVLSFNLNPAAGAP